MSRGPEKQFNPEVVLSKAMEVFWARGYEAASLSELTERMGIGKKSLYDTFGNKRSLFLKTLEYYTQTVLKSMRERLFAPGSPLANLESLLWDMQQTHAMAGSKGCLIGTNCADFDTSDKDMAKVLQGYLQQIEDIYYEVVKRAQVAGEIDQSVDARNLARMLLCTTQGMALIGRVLDRATIPQSVVKATIAILKAV